MRKKVVFVGLSGGVDSAVSATLLKKKGYEVVGVFMRVWHPEYIPCNEEEERLDAMRVAAHLDIPFLTFDFEDVYKRDVADYMISEYKAGRTPNPDVMCNKHVKFGAFLKKALSMGALVRPLAEIYVATGHYARVASQPARLDAKTLQVDLLKGKDPSKDQSYFLWTLNQKQLSKTLFPVGNLNKTEVRKKALKFNLPVAEKKDSQGICFLGPVDLKEFLKHYIKEKKGKVCSVDGEVIGHHNGVTFNTLGERHGFTITKKSPNDKPYYVVGKDLKKNILIVSQNKVLNHSTILTNYSIGNTNWIKEIPKKDKTYTAQIRYHGEFLLCQVICARLGFAQVIFQKPILVASGQSIVIYYQDVCLGGGTVV